MGKEMEDPEVTEGVGPGGIERWQMALSFVVLEQAYSELLTSYDDLVDENQALSRVLCEAWKR